MARISIEHIQDNAPCGVDPWLTPKAVAELTGLDTKWLAAAREGRKSVRGPEYVKIGEGRTCPIRYQLSVVIAWMTSFKTQDTTVMYRETGPWPPSIMIAYEMSVIDNPGTFPGTGPIPTARTFNEWLNNCNDGSAIWPFVATKIGLIDAFRAMSLALTPEKALDKIHWLKRDEWSAQG